MRSSSHDSRKLHRSTSDADDVSMFQTLLESPSEPMSPSIASVSDDDTIPLRQLPVYAHGSKRLSQRRVRWLDDIVQKSSILTWMDGTAPYEKLSIKPLYPQIAARVQAALTAWSPRKSLSASCAIVMFAWAIAFVTILATSYSEKLSSDERKPVRLECHTRLWTNTTFCGYNGENCAPFIDNDFTFLCPSQCASVRVLEPHIIGDREVVYTNMVIGGTSQDKEFQNSYRGDSFICQAAIHAGVISDSKGGCGTLARIGERRNFVGTQSNGISSIDFSPAFPLAYTISAAPGRCADTQWNLLAISVAASALISLLATTPQQFITLLTIIIFFQISLASDRPYHPELSGLISMAFERFLPTTFVVYTIYRFCIHRTLGGMQAQLEKTLFWTGGCWVGALNNYTFDRMPISRLTIHDIRQQPGAVTALLFIILLIAVAAFGQIAAFRAEGRLLQYVLLYCIAGCSIGVLAFIPSLQLRLHHYILALVLLPGTSTQTRRSLLYQGLLFGLFLNGIARWGYASILQTADALREDGQLGSAVPNVVSPAFSNQTTIRFTIDYLAKGFDGISVLVNDVERYRVSATSLPVLFDWTRSSANEPTYFRFAFTSFMPLGGMTHGDFTKPGIWHKDGTWEDIKVSGSR